MVATLRRILRFWAPHRALGIGLVVVMVLRAVFTVVLAFALKFVIDQVIDPTPGTSVWTVAGLLLGGFAVSFLAGLIGARLTARATAEIIADVRMLTFDHLQRLPMSYHDRTAIGDLMAYFSSDIAQISQGVIRKPLVGLRALTAMVLYVPVMFILDPGLAAVALVGIPLAVWIVYRFAPASAPALDDEKQRIADVLGEVSGNLRAQRIIRAYGLSGQSRDRFSNRIAALREASELAERRIALEMIIAEYAVELVKLVIIVLGAALAFAGELEPGSLAAFVAILTEFAYQASVLGMDVLPSVKQSEAGIRRLDSLLALPPTPSRPGAAPAPAMSGPIELRDVVFRYREDDDPQLDQVSIVLPGESYVAVVGPNGAGKSSLLNVILDLYGLESGSVSVSGVDLSGVDIDDMRGRVGIAFQDTVLFDTSLEENLTLGATGHTGADLDRAVRESGLDEVVERLPGGLGAHLGPGGVSLSTGEAQRVGIARALLRDPELLLLDEVASGLDPASESALMGQIEGLREGRTIVAVTHRLESVKTADLITVIDRGAIGETGTFEELLAADGLFAEMWTKQHGFDVSANGMSARVRSERLGEIPIFTGLSDEVLADLAAVFQSRFVGHGEVVFREGDLGDAFYVIARGVVEVVRGLGTRDETVVAWLEDGDFFGEMALLSSERRNATIRTRGATTLLRLDRSAFRQLMATVPRARAAVEEAAAARSAENRAGMRGRDG